MPMPTRTFFQLPAAKRRIVLNACWEEFTQFSYVETSINRMIRRARIPRGSFYQYFEDKRDIFFYLLQDAADRFRSCAEQVLRAQDHDATDAALRVFHNFAHVHTVLTRSEMLYTQVLHLNPWLDWQQWLFHNDLASGRPDTRPDAEALSAVTLVLFLCKQYILDPGMTAEDIYQFQTQESKNGYLMQSPACPVSAAFDGKNASAT